MTRRLFTQFLAVAALGIATLAGPSVRAQGDGGPTLILTAKSTGELIGDLAFLASSVSKPDDPQLAPVLAGLERLKQPDALQGIDPSKPFGMFVTLPEKQGELPTGVLFVPVLDAKKLLETLGGVGATVEEEKEAKGFTHRVMLPNVPMPLFVAQGGGYLYFSMASVGAEALVAMKPASLLPKREGAGDLSLTIRLDRIPEMYKEQFNAGLEQSLEAQKEKKPEEKDAEYQARLAGMKMTQDAMIALVRDGKELSLDLVIDPKTQFVGLELNSSAVAASAYAKALRKLGSMKSKFTGMTTDAAFGGYVAIPVSEAIRDLLGKAFDQGLAQAKKDEKLDEAAKQLAEEITPAVRDTITADTLDLGIAIQGPSSGNTYTMSFAGAVKGGAKFDKAIREAAKSMPADKKKNLTLDFAKAGDGTPIHKMANVDDKPGPFGESTVYAAFRDDVAAISIGKSGQAALSSALAASKGAAASSGAQIEAFIAASRIAGLNPESKDRDAMTAAAAEIFTGAAAKKDRISLILRAEGDAAKIRFGADVPALKFLIRVGEILH